jgi:hypothetical protein
MKTPLLWIAAAVVLLANTGALLRVAANRRGEPTNIIELTNRELPVRFSDTESRTIVVGVEFNRAHVDWLDVPKLASLGFDMSVPASDRAAARHYRRQRSRRAYVAFEYAGESWRRWEAEHESKLSGMTAGAERTMLEKQLHSHSRLFPVDASPEFDSLRSRYRDLRRFLIVPGMVAVSFWQEKTGEKNIHVIRGSVSRLLIDRIHLPRLFANRVMGEGRPEASWTAPSFEAKLQYGRLFEPQILDLVVPAGTR